MILLNDEEIGREYEAILEKSAAQWDSVHVARHLTKATGKKILIQLQAIYNIPDLGAEDRRMGEFIQELMEEVE